MDRIDIIIPRDHPSAAGHFPGNPIVPGALLLSEVVHAWESLIGAPTITITIKVAKFLSPTRPGDTVSISFERLKPATVKFTCVVKDTPVLSGSFDYAVADSPR